MASTSCPWVPNTTWSSTSGTGATTSRWPPTKCRPKSKPFRSQRTATTSWLRATGTSSFGTSNTRGPSTRSPCRWWAGPPSWASSGTTTSVMWPADEARWETRPSPSPSPASFASSTIEGCSTSGSSWGWVWNLKMGIQMGGPVSSIQASSSFTFGDLLI